MKRTKARRAKNSGRTAVQIKDLGLLAIKWNPAKRHRDRTTIRLRWYPIRKPVTRTTTPPVRGDTGEAIIRGINTLLDRLDGGFPAGVVQARPEIFEAVAKAL